MTEKFKKEVDKHRLPENHPDMIVTRYTLMRLLEKVASRENPTEKNSLQMMLEVLRDEYGNYLTETDTASNK